MFLYKNYIYAFISEFGEITRVEGKSNKAFRKTRGSLIIQRISFLRFLEVFHEN